MDGRRKRFTETVSRALSGAEFGFTPHPVFSKTHGAFLRAIAEGPDPRAPYVRAIVAEAERLPKEAERLDEREVTRRVHRVHARHAALGYAWVPEWPKALARIIEDVRFEWGARASNEPPGMVDVAFAALGGPALGQGDTMARLGSEAHFDRVDFLTLGYLDFAREDAIIAATPEDVRFACGCGREMTRPLDRAAQVETCDCGAEVEVPVPPLGEILKLLREREEIARGVTRCRQCGAVVQTSKGPIQAAGFCTKLCAVQAGVSVDDPRAAPRRGPATCAKCGRKSPWGHPTCQYCGERTVDMHCEDGPVRRSLPSDS